MKKCIYVIMLFLLASFASATQVIEIDHEVDVDFRGDDEFIITIDDTFSRSFIRQVNDSFDDDRFIYTYYHTIDEKTFCSEFTNVDEYKNLTLEMTNMFDICSAIVLSWNSTENYRKETAEAIRDREIYESMLEDCEDDYDDYVNESEEMSNDYSMCQDELKDCENDLIDARGTATGYSTCAINLEKCEEDRNTYGLGGVLLGLGIGYFLWKRKAKNVPSEHEEAGVTSDGAFQPSFDGPKD